MPVPVQTLRSYTPGNRPPEGKLEGELYVNFPDKVLGVVDPTGIAVDLTGRILLKENVRYWVSLDGSDETGNGSEEAPWQTLEGVGNFLSKQVDVNNKAIAIKLGAGEFKAGTINTIGGNFIINGEGIDQTTIVTNPVTFSGLILSGSNATYQIINCGFKSRYGTMLYIGKGITCFLSDTILDGDVSTSGLISVYGTLYNSGSIELRMTGRNCYGPAILVDGGYIDEGGIYNLIGEPNTYTCWEQIINFGNHKRSGSGQGFTGVGIIGKKFEMANGSICGTGNVGVDFWPGTLAGTCDPSSFYDGVPGNWISRINGGTF